MNHKNFKIIVSLLLVAVICCLGLDLDAQCPMCRLSAEQNLKDGGTAGKGLNTGILFLLALPYLVVGTIGFIWYKRNFKTE